MSVLDVLDKRVVDLNMRVKNKDEAIKHLSGLLKEAGYIDNISEFVENIYERESEGITGIGEHIAIPHGKSDSVKNIGIAIGKLENMIEWESLDDKPVDIIFLFAVSKNLYNSQHLKLLGDLAGRLGRNNTISKLRELQSFEDLLEAFGDELEPNASDKEILEDEIDIEIRTEY